LLTVLGSSLLGIAFGILSSTAVGFLLRSNSRIRRSFFESPKRWGLGMGLVGFAVFQGIPAIGIPPALPGVVGADVDYSVRQAWWLTTIACSLSAVGLSIYFLAQIRRLGLVLRGSLLVAVLGILGFPFFGMGIPEYSRVNLVTGEMVHQFVSTSLGVSLCFWVVLAQVLSKLIRQKGRQVFIG
jgi:predicted cobalt transporter CbtA